MVILAVDSCPKDLETLTHALEEVYAGEQIVSFTHPLLAVKYVANSSIDLAYIRFEMKVDGLELSNLMRKVCPGIQAILIVSDEAACPQAIRKGICEIVIYPITAAKIKHTN